MKKKITFKKLLLIAFTIVVLIYSNKAYSQFSCGDDLIDTRVNRIYKTIEIGQQCWMAENLGVGTMVISNGDGQLMYDNGIIEKYCWNNDSLNCDNDTNHPGGYYEWPEAVQNYSGQPNEPTSGICPTGWHIPSKSEFQTLLIELGGASVAGEKLKKGGSSGFNAVLAGWRCAQSSGSFFDIYPFLTPPALIAFYYSSTKSATTPYFLTLNANVPSASIETQYSEYLGFNIRCIKDGISSVENYNNPRSLEFGRIDVNNESLTINYMTRSEGTLNFVLSDIEGKKIVKKNHNTSPGENTLSIGLTDVSSGIYIISIQQNDNIISRKIMIP